MVTAYPFIIATTVKRLPFGTAYVTYKFMALLSFTQLS